MRRRSPDGSPLTSNKTRASARQVPKGLDANQRLAFGGIRDEDHFARADTHPLVERQVRWNGFAARLRIPGVCALDIETIEPHLNPVVPRVERQLLEDIEPSILPQAAAVHDPLRDEAPF